MYMGNTKYHTNRLRPAQMLGMLAGSSPTAGTICETRVNTGLRGKASIYAGLRRLTQ